MGVVSRFGTVAPTVFRTSNVKNFLVTSFGVTGATFSYRELLGDIKTGTTFHRQCMAKNITLKFMPINACNTASTLATAVVGCTATLTYIDITSGSTSVRITPYKPLSLVNSVVLRGTPPPAQTVWEESDSVDLAYLLEVQVPVFTTQFALQVYIDAEFYMARDEGANLL